MKKLINKLFESPDKVNEFNEEWGYLKNIAEYNDDDAFAFGIIDGKMYISNPAGTHTFTAPQNITKKLLDKKKVTFAREIFEYPGRIWIDKKLISFWIYPKSNKELENIIHKIEKAFKDKYNKKIDIWNDPNFRIEINNAFEFKSDIKSPWNEQGDGAWEVYNDETQDLIPLKEFKKSKDFSDGEIRREHQMSPLEKGDVKVPKGWGDWYHKDAGSYDRLKWKYAHKNESKNNKLIDRLFESPDRVYNEYGNEIASWEDNDAIAFGIFEDELLVGSSPYDTHYNILDYYAEDGKWEDKEWYSVEDIIDEYQYKYDNIVDGRQLFDYPGRIWLKKKIISFWEYPSRGELKKIILNLEKELENNLGQKFIIWNDPEYKLEIVQQENNLDVKDELEGQWAEYWDENDNFVSIKSKIIPLQKYQSSLNFDDENTLELEKQVKNKQKYLSNKDKTLPKDYKQKGNEKYLKWKYAHKNESKNDKLINPLF